MIIKNTEEANESQLYSIQLKYYMHQYIKKSTTTSLRQMLFFKIVKY